MAFGSVPPQPDDSAFINSELPRRFRNRYAICSHFRNSVSDSNPSLLKAFGHREELLHGSRWGKLSGRLRRPALTASLPLGVLPFAFHVFPFFFWLLSLLPLCN